MEPLINNTKERILTMDDYMDAITLFNKGLKRTPLSRILKLTYIYLFIVFIMIGSRVLKQFHDISFDIIKVQLPSFLLNVLIDDLVIFIVLGVFFVFFLNIWLNRVLINTRKRQYAEFVAYPLLSANCCISFNEKLVFIHSVNNSYTRTTFWSELTFVFKNKNMALLGISKSYYLIVPLDWFDTKELEEQFIHYSKAANNWKEIT
ncbi:YcxB family protein [Thorsellia anophelis]|uniref:YcxB-like C-terminal domain-containing protein n=1 Tax=Thorsellia anophelis DSM 18579 TaxID=1123402 RepID=A0A1I0CT79_9GAMM|nr:YcxB family protein [Thorsellia anophelis]SET22801.1 hypothetical protein SAMN02583745_01722 [Thorsellia anophelis DSM 18579]